MISNKIISVILSVFILISNCALPVYAAQQDKTGSKVGEGDNISEGDVWDDDDGTTHYSLHVNGEFFSSAKLTVSCGGGTAQFDPVSSTLTLNNAMLSKTPSKGTIYADSAIGCTLPKLTIVLKGKTVYDEGDSDHYFFRTSGSAVFTGDGTIEMVKAGSDGSIRTNVKIDVDKDITAENVNLERIVVPTAKNGDLRVQNAAFTNSELRAAGSATLENATLKDCKIYAEKQIILNDCDFNDSYGLLDECTSLKTLTVTAEHFGDDVFDDLQQRLFGSKYLSQLRIFVPVRYVYRFKRALPDFKLQVFADGPALLGDVDGDGDVNINDVTVIQRHLAELEQLEGIYFHAADTNQDGTVDISDATTLQMYLAEYVIPYPIGEVMTQ